MKKAHILGVEGISEGDWIWCLHCERCYKAGEFDERDELQMCPYGDCDGDTMFDAFPWEKIRSGHPEYPKTPERGKNYPMY